MIRSIPYRRGNPLLGIIVLFLIIWLVIPLAFIFGVKFIATNNVTVKNGKLQITPVTSGSTTAVNTQVAPVTTQR